MIKFDIGTLILAYSNDVFDNVALAIDPGEQYDTADQLFNMFDCTPKELIAIPIPPTITSTERITHINTIVDLATTGHLTTQTNVAWYKINNE